MSQYANLKAAIAANVYENHKNEVTANMVKAAMNAMTDSLGAGYQCLGIATPTSPGTAQTPDQKVLYIATTPGTYTYLGGLVVNDGEVAFLKYDTAWHKEVTGAATAAQVTELGQKMIDYCDKYFAETAKIYLDKTINNTTGIQSDSTSQDCSALIPLKGGMGLVVSGATLRAVFFYSDNVIDTAHYLGMKYSSTTDRTIPAGSKYVVLLFDKSANPGGYGDFKYTYIYDLNKYIFSSGCFELRNVFFIEDTAISSVALQNIAVKSFSIKGADPTAMYYLSITNTTVCRVILWNSAHSVEKDYYISNQHAETGVKDLEIDVSATIKIRCLIDFSLLSNFNSNKGVVNTPILGLRAFNTADFESIPASRISFNNSGTGMLATDVQNALVEINEDVVALEGVTRVETDETEIVDLSNQYTIDGYINSGTGAYSSSTSFVCTDYIKLTGVQAVKPLLPEVGTQAGCAFYDKDKVKLSYSVLNALSNTWIILPEGAVYFRGCVRTSQTPSLQFKKYATIPVNEAVKSYSKPEIVRPLNDNVFATYGMFLDEDGNTIETSRVNLTADNDGSGEQIKLAFNCRILNHETKASVLVNDADSIVTFGDSDYRPETAADYDSIIEARIYNDNGSGILKVFRKYDGTDIEVGSVVLGFNLVAGEYYYVGYRKVDFDEPVEGVAYGYGEFFVTRVSTGVSQTLRFTYANSIQYNGVLGSFIANLSGRPYFGIIDGDVDFVNFYVTAKQFKPQVKGMIVGDSFIAGNTMSGGDMWRKYAALLQTEIGNTDFMVVGKGGESVSDIVLTFFPYLMNKYQPAYCIIALGVNNSDFSVYKSGMQQLLEVLNARSICPVLTTITPMKYGSNPDFYHDVRVAVNEYVRTSGYRYIDICKAVTISDQTEWKEGYVMDDGTHPSVTGHQAIYNAFVNELPELFE